MTTSQGPDITTEILIQIRDETRGMKASFERRFDTLEARMGAIEGRDSGTEARMDTPRIRVDSPDKRDSLSAAGLARLEQLLVRLEAKIDALQVQVDFIHGRIDNLEVKLDSMEERGEAHYQGLSRGFNLMDSDFKKFVSVANQAILHYAGEMDSVRERVLVIEAQLGIPHPSE
ncbi:MAG: hypothetical protein HY912_05830 [Desulfomonile tiedjei]|uniref:Uncharacterized protein n=1 Tax=Desulfomonile tiedjei TaxID=2358 RepID=A0A9D6Z2W8_9BACT|nr:hypothetical protein [Desulfomonile tiedjei]